MRKFALLLLALVLALGCMTQVKHVLMAYARGLDTASYAVPGGITAIGKDAFYKNDVLTGITLPEGVAFIDAGAFSYCSALESI